MKNLIYQYWDGEIRIGCKAGVENMKRYADKIGAEYLFEENPKFVTTLGSYSPHYGAFKPIFDESFHKYDNILFADTDIFAVEDLEENIFENFNAEVGICTEPDQPHLRQKSAGQKTVKNKWRIEVPRTPEGLVKVYNSGVVLYSNSGLLKAKEKFVPFKEYVDMIKSTKLIPFYTCDQPYLHAMLQVADMDWVELDNGWNSYIHYTREGTQERQVNDTRTKDTKFVHIQLAGADHWDAAKLERVANLPRTEWNL